MSANKTKKENDIINLKDIKLSSAKFFLSLLETRQSIRRFSPKPLSLKEVSLLLWAAAGKKLDAISSASRTVPSAGGCYPIEVYLYVQKNGVKALESGLYHYLPDSHSLKLVSPAIDNQKLIKACWDQSFIKQSPVVMVVSAVFQRTTSRYGNRGQRYVYLDAGHVGQNIYLMATQLKLATVEIGAFDDFELADCLNLPAQSRPILVMPAGYPFE